MKTHHDICYHLPFFINLLLLIMMMIKVHERTQNELLTFDLVLVVGS